MAFLIPENLRSRRDVPPAVTRLARLVQESLDDGATAWYEPLFDGSGERPDLVVLVPDAGVLILEVFAEKSATIRGAEGDHLQVGPANDPRTVEGPLSRADRFAENLRSRITDASFAQEDERLPVRAGGVFAYMSRDDADSRGLGDALDLSRCLFRDDLDCGATDPGAFRRTLSQLFDAPLRDLISTEAEKLHRALIHPDTVIGSPQLPFLSATPEQSLKVLDRKQESLAKNLGEGHRVVRGVAGSGKTLVLTYRARLLAEMFPKQTVLITCFNRSLKGVLARQLSLPNVKVATIDELIGGALRVAGTKQPPFATNDLAARASLALQALDSHGPQIPRYDHVLVDEAQDFPTEALQLVVRLLRDGSDSLLVVADAAQNIYRQKFTWKAAGINASGRTRILSTSYRNTREILQYAHDFLLRDNTLRVDADGSVEDESAVIPPHFSDRPGPLPAFRFCASPQAEVVAIADHCKELIAAGASPADVGVLYGRTTIRGFNWPQAILAALSAAGVSAFWATDHEKRDNRLLFGADPTKVTVSTIHAAKGLEFKNVILCGYLDDRPPEQQIVNRRVIYVGMTRATHELVLTASGRHEYIADLEL